MRSLTLALGALSMLALGACSDNKSSTSTPAATTTTTTAPATTTTPATGTTTTTPAAGTTTTTQ